MRASARLASAALVLVACVPPGVRGQDASIAYPAGAYIVTTPAPTTIERGPGYVTLRWAPAPTPPAPTPAPAPVADSVPLVTGPAYLIAIHAPSAPVTLGKALVDSAAGMEVAASALPADNPRASSWVAKVRERTGTEPALPIYVVTQDDPTNPGHGVYRHHAALPPDDAGILAVIKRLRGRP